MPRHRATRAATAALMTALVAPAAPGASAAQPPQSVPYGSLVEVTDDATRAAAAGVDLTGEWAPRFHEDQPERVPGPELGDYLGIPINLAARMRGEVWEASIQTLWEWQCRPHSADYIWRGPSPVRIWKEVDPRLATDHRVARRVAAIRRSADLHGWAPAPVGVRAAHVGRILHRPVGGRQAHHQDDAPEGRLPAPQRPAAQRPGDADRALDAPRRRPHGGDDHLRSGLPHRAVHPHDRLRARSAPADPALSLRTSSRKSTARKAPCRTSCRARRTSSPTSRSAAAFPSRPPRAARKRCIPQYKSKLPGTAATCVAAPR